jgi:hypothetical protein
MGEGTWFCDTCGGVIKDSTHGWVEWLTKTEGKRTEYGLRVVHHAPHSPRRPASCQYDARAELNLHGAIVSDTHLDRFLGPDGLIYLLLWLEQDKLPKKELFELIRRLHIKDYELVRKHLNRAVAENIIDEAYPPAYYSQEQIKAVLDWIETEHEE